MSDSLQRLACPVCGDSHPREPTPRTVEVCLRCHTMLTDGGTMRLSSTGEFRVDQLLAAAAESAPRIETNSVAPPSPTASESPTSVRCSWCAKREVQVRKLLSRGPLVICDECVSLCAEVLRAELGDDWR